MLKFRKTFPVITAILALSCFSAFTITVSQNAEIAENTKKLASVNDYFKTVSNGNETSIDTMDEKLSSWKRYDSEKKDTESLETMFFARKVLFGWNSEWGEPKETVFSGNVLDVVIVGFENTSKFQRYATKLQQEGILSFSTVKLSKSEVSGYSDSVSEEYVFKIVFNSDIVHEKLLKSDSIMRELMVESSR